MRYSPRMLFTLGILIVSGYAVITSSAWPLTMSLFPWIVGIPVFILSLIQLGMEIYRSRSAGGLQKEDTGDLQVDLSMSGRVVAIRAGRFFGWLLGFFFCVWILGFFIAVPLYTFLYLKYEAKESWILSIALTVATFIFFAGLFDQILHLAWTEPLIGAPEEFIRAWIPELPEFV
jgi:Tripartite tricarboxylate transporter TctB family